MPGFEISLDLKEIIDLLKKLLRPVLGAQIPSWLATLTAYTMLILLALLVAWGFLLVLSKIIELWTEKLKPRFYDEEERCRSARRRQFADHIESEIRRLNSQEEWKEYRYAELEAEVEAEGRRQGISLLPFVQRTRTGLCREPSLSRALESSQERLILLQGEPGSGKSVALRHVAQAMARRAMKARTTNSVIPIYINLKELERSPTEVIDRNLIESFVLQSLNRARDRDVEVFLEEEFDRGLREGTWLFLFDSFDELPEILGATEADRVVRNYADAIADFLHGMNQCRGIIASRQFRGPHQFGWPRFRILSLSESRRLWLVRRAGLQPKLEKELVGELEMAEQEIRAMASNPMFLGLICEHVKAGHPFPENVQSVFESYVETRLARDAERLQRRFKVEPLEVRAVGESAAFCMAADPGLGLNPIRKDLKNAMVRHGFEVTNKFDTLLNALVYLKLGRSEPAPPVGKPASFTFAHRRFQEYFATCVALREPGRVSPIQLLKDARWRETAIVMCQTQPLRKLLYILEEARNLLSESLNSLSGVIDDPLAYVHASESAGPNKETERKCLPTGPFPWPSDVLHILALLQAGFSGRLRELPDSIRMYAARLILTASCTGTLFDKKWGLEVAGIIPQPILLWLLRDAFEGQSQWVKEVAYRQVARLGEIPEDVARSIRQTLLKLWSGGRLRRERYATHAHLRRLDKSARFLSVARLLRWVRSVDLGLHIFTLSILLSQAVGSSALLSGRQLFWIILVLNSHLSLRWGSKRRVWYGICFSTRGGFLALFLLACIAWFRGEISLANPLVFAYIYAALWAPLALYAASTGLLTHPILWTLVPVCPFCSFFLNPRDILEPLKALSIVGAIALLLFFPGILLEAIGAPLTFQVWITVLCDMIYPVYLGMMLVLIILAIVYVHRWVRDWIRWYSWNYRHESRMTAQEFIRSLSQYHHEEFRCRLLRTIRGEGLLIASEHTEILLTNMAFVVESAILDARKEMKELPEMIKRPSLALKRILGQKPKRVLRESTDRSSQTERYLPIFRAFELWSANYTRNDWTRLWLSKSEPEFLDEICKLLEQVHVTSADRRQHCL